MKFTHSEDHWIKCPACDKKSKNAQQVNLFDTNTTVFKIVSIFFNNHPVVTLFQLRGHYLAKHLKVTIKPIECVTCNSSYVREKDCWIHIAMKHEGSSNQVCSYFNFHFPNSNNNFFSFVTAIPQKCNQCSLTAFVLKLSFTLSLKPLFHATFI